MPEEETNFFCSDEELETFLENGGERLIRSVIARYGAELEFDDAHQEALRTVARALKKYDSSRNVKQTTYVYKAVANTFRMIKRQMSEDKWKANQNTVSIEDAALNLSSTFDTEGNYLKKERREIAEEACRRAKLSQLEAVVYTESMDGTTQQELADRLGRSQGGISTIKSRAIKKVSKEIKKMDRTEENSGGA